MCACVALPGVRHSEDNLQETTLSFHPVSPGTKLRSHGLSASAFTGEPLPQSGGSNYDKDHHVLGMP